MISSGQLSTLLTLAFKQLSVYMTLLISC